MPKYQLNVPERLVLMGLLPKEGNFITLKTIRDTMDLIGFKEEDLKLYEIKQNGEQTNWNKKGNEEKEFDLGEKATNLKIEALQKLDKENKLIQNQFSLFEKFIKGGK